MDGLELTNPEKDNDPQTIKKSLDELVHKLEPDSKTSKSWSDTMDNNREEWEKLKQQILDRQKALKELVQEKKAGSIGSEEFKKKYRVIQDELTQLEFEVYNLRLGTDVKP